MSMASSQSQNSRISTDTLSSMSGSYLPGAEGDERHQNTPESRPVSQQEGDVRLQNHVADFIYQKRRQPKDY